jgi:hypothetical protein
VQGVQGVLATQAELELELVVPVAVQAALETRGALLVVWAAVAEAARVACPMWEAVRALTYRRPPTGMLGAAAISMRFGPAETSLA